MIETTKRILDRKYDPAKKPPKIDPILEIYSAGRWHSVARKNSLGAVVGRMKSRKTLIMSYIVASAISRKDVNIFRCIPNPNPDSYIIYVDTEQSMSDFYTTQERIRKISGLDVMPENYIAVPTLGESKYDTRMFIVDLLDSLIRDGKKIGALFVDGVVDICDDYMSNVKAEEAIKILHNYTNTVDLVMTVLHLNKDGKETRGALGTELDNKCGFQIKVEKKLEEDTFSRISSKLSRSFSNFPSTTVYQQDNGFLRDVPELLNYIDMEDDSDDSDFSSEMPF
jgi:hypothetical protein